ncbi:MAG: CARDB domain-containing protein [Chloroflexota bacterium]
MKNTTYLPQKMVAIMLMTLLLLTSIPMSLFTEDTGGYLPVATASEQTTRSPMPIPSHTLFRTHIQIATKSQWRMLDEMGVTILDSQPRQRANEQQVDEAVVLVDIIQLEDLARWQYHPQQTEDFSTLIAADKNTNTANLQPLLTQMQTFADMNQQVRAATTINASAEFAATLTNLRSAVQHLTSAQKQEITAIEETDSDGDGVTDTVEGFWCTDPSRADTDFDGTDDGEEIARLKAWMNNEVAGPPSTGKPFLGWPHQKSECYDDDSDAVPDIAERLDLGLNASRESTDRDKFDDGQELFGITYCQGNGGYCSYGALPRNEDWGVIFAEMPAWVRAPGNHPLVAAYPVPEVDIVPSSFRVETVTEVTTENAIAKGTERSYSTSKTEGTSTSVANTTTWNDWQEVFDSSERTGIVAASYASHQMPYGVIDDIKEGAVRATKAVVATGVAALGCLDISANANLNLKYKGIGVSGGAKAGFNDQFNNAKCSSSMDLARQMSPDVARFLPEEQNTMQPGNVTVNPINRVHVDNHVVVNNNFDTDNIVHALDGIQFAQLQTGEILGEKLYDISVALKAPRLSTGSTSGRSSGGSQTTTTERYEEHTITQGQAFSSEESWAKATAVDSVHTADFWFTYKVRNSGTEYAREIANLAFNIYIGDDPNPAYTYFVAPDLGGNGKFENFMPNEEHAYTSRRIPLSLAQMKAIDLGGSIRIVVEDFTYGIDELFYADASNSGMMLVIEDGMDDGDQLTEPYLVPTWGDETLLQVLGRYFPHETDEDGHMIAIWTPEFGKDMGDAASLRCVEPREIGINLFCKHALSTADWWNIYTSGLGEISEGFQDAKAMSGSVALFRFNQDRDFDGYSDRSETRLGTDPADASSFPRPELLAGVHNIRTGNRVVSTLSLHNRGFYDAYGIEAVMIAPDDSISINDNTVGGSGRVRAQKQVIVGSRLIMPSPMPAPWTQDGYAVPAIGGYYTGSSNRSYTFRVNCGNSGGCTVGSGSWTLDWTDSAGKSGSLSMGSGYASPTFLAVGDLGVTVALYSGIAKNGDAITIQAQTPSDTFEYTINREPYTEPLVLVSYNDAQGNHGFVLPTEAMALASPADNLAPFSGKMLGEVGVALVTKSDFAPGVNSVELLVNNPSDSQLTNAHLYLEMIALSGNAIAEIHKQVTLPPGPSYTTMSFDSTTFAPDFQVDNEDGEDYIVMAFLTDYQGNILDTSARPLSSFQDDPLPRARVDQSTLTWDAGTLEQGTLAKMQFSLSNTGFERLYTYLMPASGFSLSRSNSHSIGVANVANYEVLLNTNELPVGALDQVLTLKTSDPDNPAVEVHVTGSIVDAIPDVPASGLVRPLDILFTLSGSYSEGDWVDLNHDLGGVHPVKIYSHNYTTLFGVGEHVTHFMSGTESFDMFGDGRDGVMPASGNLHYDNGFGVGSINGSKGSRTVSTTDRYAVWRIEAGDVVLLHQTQGSGAGCWELNKATTDFQRGTGWKTYELATPLQCTYSNSGNNRAQILRVPQYSTCNVTGTVTPMFPWNGTIGGIFAVMCQNALHVSGKIDATGTGFRGGVYGTYSHDNKFDDGTPGESFNGVGSGVVENNFGGGGAGFGNYEYYTSRPGAGGGYGSLGHTRFPEWNRGSIVGQVYGDPELKFIHLGSGGGTGADTERETDGGAGGGIVFISAKEIDITGSIFSNGGNGVGGRIYSNKPQVGGGGGGSGGAIFIRTYELNRGVTGIHATGGEGGMGYPSNIHNNQEFNGGDGGDGRIRVESCKSSANATNPVASTKKLQCHIAEQHGTPSSGQFRLNLPNAITREQSYNIQFGHRIAFASQGSQVVSLRIPAGMVNHLQLDALVSGLSANSTLSLDIGNDGSVDWSGTVGNNSTNVSPNLADVVTEYWQMQGGPMQGTLDIPVKVTLARAGQVLLTNLQVQTTGQRIRHVQLPANTYTTFNLDFSLDDAGSIAIDIGNNGSIDWTTTIEPNTGSTRQWTGNLAAALNGYLAGKSGTVDVPIRFYVSPDQSVTLNNYTAAFNETHALRLRELQVGNGLQAANTGEMSVEEGSVIPLKATIQNDGNVDTGILTAAFVAQTSAWGDWYVGSGYVENLSANGQAEVGISWDTTGFASDEPVQVKVILNPHQYLQEANYDDNSAAQAIAITEPPTQVVDEGDINGDGEVNIFDLQILIQMILHPTPEDEQLYPLERWQRGNLNGTVVPSGP